MRYPLILTHGFARFDILVHLARSCLPAPAAIQWFNGAVGDAWGYFRHVQRTLERHGFEVHEVATKFGGSLQSRARALRGAVERILGPSAANPQGKVSIIAHSMGGLDARYMITRLGMADRVAALATIGTPHLGSSFADWRLKERKSAPRAIAMLGSLGVDMTGAFDLTTAQCREFCAASEPAEAANAVTYIAYASAQEDEESVFRRFRRAWGILRKREGPNDGLVSVPSQLWQAELKGPTGTKRVEQRVFPLPADHLNQCAWWHPWTCPLRDRHAFERKVLDVYVEIAEDLRARGLGD